MMTDPTTPQQIIDPIRDRALELAVRAIAMRTDLPSAGLVKEFISVAEVFRMYLGGAGGYTRAVDEPPAVPVSDMSLDLNAGMIETQDAWTLEKVA